jgi:uncharacterized delta-60 repeat protein
VRLALELLEDRLTPTAGVLDPTFGAGAGYVLSQFSPNGANDGVNAVAVQSNGKIVIAGTTAIPNSHGTTIEFLVARYNADGSLDTSFGSGGHTVTGFNKSIGAYGEAVALQSDGKILAAGYAPINAKGTLTDNFALARYNANGTLDTTFGNNGEVLTPVGAMADSMAVQTDGKILVGGGTTLVRYNANGTLDTTFGNGGELVNLPISRGVGKLLIQPDGKIVITGNGGASGTLGVAVARFNANGTADSSFGNGGEVITFVAGSNGNNSSGMALQADGKIVVSGGAEFDNGVEQPIDPYLIRYNADGTLDTTFGSSGNGIVAITPAGSTGFGKANGVDIQSDGKIITTVGVNNFVAAVRVNADGSLDTSYGNGGWATVEIGYTDNVAASVLQPDGRLLLVGGELPTSGQTPRYVSLIRLLQSEPAIGSFTANPNPVASGSSTTLMASNITDGNPNSTITQVTFYYYDLTGNKVVLGTGTSDGSGDWILNFNVNLASGTYTLYAQAQDNYGVLGDPDALTLTVQ